MIKAANKYKSLVQNSTWKAPDEVDYELIALCAEVNHAKTSKLPPRKKEWIVHVYTKPKSKQYKDFLSPNK